MFRPPFGNGGVIHRASRRTSRNRFVNLPANQRSRLQPRLMNAHTPSLAPSGYDPLQISKLRVMSVASAQA